MSMSPIRSLNKPEEISVNDMNNSFAKKAEIAPESDSVHTAVPTTKVPFIYEIAKTKSFDDPFSVVEREKDMMKLKRDVFRLRNEMNLVKSLLNKLYKKSYKKQKEFLVKRNSDSTTRLSAVQADRNHSDWVVIRGKVLRAKNRHTNVD
uniref:Uncharacterized protein n=2 Tax=Caenorhabditis japonica TaxID=281687 RepID=A0A8R1HNY0_CAEJA